MDEKRINEIYEGIQDGAIAPPVTEMLECLRLARLGLWAEKHAVTYFQERECECGNESQWNDVAKKYVLVSYKCERCKALEEMPK